MDGKGVGSGLAGCHGRWTRIEWDNKNDADTRKIASSLRSIAKKTAASSGWDSPGIGEQLALKKLQRHVCWLARNGRQSAQREIELCGGRHGAKCG